jgi:hypothetical protein
MGELMDSLGWLFFSKDQSQKLSASFIPDPNSASIFSHKHVSIITVHGLGANPDWAWSREVKLNDKEGDKERKVSWLADENLLPSQVPHARIMAFNYDTQWREDASKQRRSLYANQLLTVLHNKRNEVRCIEPWFVTANVITLAGGKYQTSSSDLYRTQLWWDSHRTGELII